jgi:hypothetical protein
MLWALLQVGGIRHSQRHATLVTRLMHLASTRRWHMHTGLCILVQLVTQAAYRDIEHSCRTGTITFAVSKRAQDVSAHDFS